MVLAQKYRPKNFDELIGQDAVSQTLSLALKNKRLSNAYLFSGLRGSGKTSSARIFSKALVCDEGPTPSPCEVCENCKMANEDRNIDIIEMDGATNRTIDSIRSLIEQTKYAPNNARFKIFIIDEVHMLTKEAFNALLKTLEEPPSYVKFILATTDPLKLPATILSRTQHFRFKKITSSLIVEHLQKILDNEKISYEIEALNMISRAGRGSLRDCLTLLDQAITHSNSNITPSDVALMLGLLDVKQLSEIFDVIFSQDKKELINIIKNLQSYESDVIIDEMIDFIKVNFFQGSVKFSTLLCERFFRILSEAKQLLSINADNEFVLSLVFLKMIEATKLKSIDELIQSFENDLQNTQNIQQLPQIQTNISNKTPQISKKVNTNEVKFQEFIKNLYDRNYELGECFEKNVKFLDYDGQNLHLKSFTPDSEKKILSSASSIIKQFAKEAFGIDTNISMQIACENELKAENNSQNTKTSQEQTEENIQNENTKEQIQKQMQNSLKTPQIPDTQSIIQSPTFQKAKDLFNPISIKIIEK